MSSVRDRAHARPRGRHLLRSSALCDSIVRDAGVRAGDLVVDVGAGTGMLTLALVRAAARVIAIEPDPVHARRLRRTCARDNLSQATVLECGIEETEWPSEPFRLVANLPFAHAADILRSLLSDPRVPLVSLDAIVEWDHAAKRARVWPSTAQSVLWGAWYELRVARRLEPRAFAPPPSCAAAVLQARRRAEPLVRPADAARYEAFLRREFRRSPRARQLDAHAWALRWQESSGRARTVKT